jgi:prepilin signal peptidase PulO-like enzyme (type II secretory pathway)
MLIVILLILGLCFGSFINALVWRLYRQENLNNKKDRQKYSILKGRSVCTNCMHQLAVKDLIPIYSWVALRGKCRYCKKTISWQYPLVELIAAIVFALFYLIWPLGFSDVWLYVWFISWLIVAVGLIALAVYDIKWMLLPDKIIYPLLGLTIFSYILQFAFGRPIDDMWHLFFASLIGGGVFWAIYQISKGKWIGGGDVKLGFLLGLLVAKPDMTLLLLFLASLLGLVFAIPLMFTVKNVSKTSKIPFGPFLIVASFVTILYGPQIIDWYKSIFLVV